MWGDGQPQFGSRGARRGRRNREPNLRGERELSLVYLKTVASFESSCSNFNVKKPSFLTPEGNGRGGAGHVSPASSVLPPGPPSWVGAGIGDSRGSDAVPQSGHKCRNARGRQAFLLEAVWNVGFYGGRGRGRGEPGRDPLSEWNLWVSEQFGGKTKQSCIMCACLIRFSYQLYSLHSVLQVLTECLHCVVYYKEAKQ